jgi:uncharacterized membrane protein
VSENLTQALIRLVVTFILAGIAAVIPLLTILEGAVPDEHKPLVAITIPIITSVLSAIAKALGGVTVQPDATVAGPLPRGAGTPAATAKRPNALAI